MGTKRGIMRLVYIHDKINKLKKENKMSQMDEVKTDLTVRIIEVLESIATSLARIEEQNSTYYKEYLHEFKENNKKTME